MNTLKSCQATADTYLMQSHDIEPIAIDLWFNGRKVRISGRSAKELQQRFEQLKADYMADLQSLFAEYYYSSSDKAA